MPTTNTSSVFGTPPSQHWLGEGASGDSRLTPGAKLAMKLGEGMVKRAPTKYIQEIRGKVTTACEELIRIGARIRPLMGDGGFIGWVRGFYDSERRTLSRWFPKNLDFIFHCLTLTTSLTEEEIDKLTSSEVNKLVRLVIAMGDRDASLFPYLSAFSTTKESEHLWHSGGGYCSFENKTVNMPDGKKLTILCPSDHARLWASLCTYREQAKKRLDESWNAVLIIRPWVGKSVDALSAELKSATKLMQAGIAEPWENIVSVPVEKRLDDGWAHVENMETKEGAYQELMNMFNNDRHERLMQEFERQQLAAAEKRKQDIEQMVANRGGVGINKEVIQILTEEDWRKKEANLIRGKAIPVPAPREQQEAPGDVRERLRRYK